MGYIGVKELITIKAVSIKKTLLTLTSIHPIYGVAKFTFKCIYTSHTSIN